MKVRRVVKSTSWSASKVDASCMSIAVRVKSTAETSLALPPIAPQQPALVGPDGSFDPLPREPVMPIPRLPRGDRPLPHAEDILLGIARAVQIDDGQLA